MERKLWIKFLQNIHFRISKIQKQYPRVIKLKRNDFYPRNLFDIIGNEAWKDRRGGSRLGNGRIRVRNASNCVYIPLQDGVYIRSIYLEGAGWDKRGSVLIEPAPMQLICNMPVIHFRPAELLRKRTRGKTTTKYRG